MMMMMSVWVSEDPVTSRGRVPWVADIGSLQIRKVVPNMPNKG
jgi:hypothetical protein